MFYNNIEGDPHFQFKTDGKMKIKPQAARFRIYGYDVDGKNLGEIDLSDEKFKGYVRVGKHRVSSHSPVIGAIRFSGLFARHPSWGSVRITCSNGEC